MLVVRFISAAIALTAIGWGFGYLVGKWFVWYRHRRKVIKWLEAESVWKTSQRISKIYRSMPKVDEYYERRERARWNAHLVPSFTTGCKPGIECWQGCDNCRPKLPNEVRGVLAESILNNSKAMALLHDKVDEIITFGRSDMIPVSGHTDPITKQLVHIYKQSVDGMGRYRYSEYRDGIFIRSWDEMSRMPPRSIDWEMR